MTDEPPAPSGPLNIIRCNCKTSSKSPCGLNTKCSCRASGLKCVALCGDCSGTECMNISDILSNYDGHEEGHEDGHEDGHDDGHEELECDNQNMFQCIFGL